MLLVPCPFCGPRPESEFRFGGEIVARPGEPGGLSDAEWAAYLHMRENPKGTCLELWLHVHGCGRYLRALRDTVDDEFLASAPMDGPPPEAPIRRLP